MTKDEAIAKVNLILADEQPCYVSPDDWELKEWLNDNDFSAYLLNRGIAIDYDLALGTEVLVHLADPVSPRPVHVCPHCGGTFTEGF